MSIAGQSVWRLVFRRRARVVVCLMVSAWVLLGAGGCGDEVRVSSERELATFRAAGPVLPLAAADDLAEPQLAKGPYRVVPGDALELTIPAILHAVTADEMAVTERILPYVCRVNEDGTIALPRVGSIQAAGSTLAQIETRIIDAYHPKHVITRPSVFARVLDYHTARVSVAGAVLRPGVYALRSDQMSVLALLMEAGGIVDEGAALIRIVRRQDGQSNAVEPLIIPIQGLNIPFADVPLRDGDAVTVERLPDPMVTVIGLVNRPGNFPYPPQAHYSLMQVIGFAGGLNVSLEPRYATVYRLKPSGTMVSAVFQVLSTGETAVLSEALNARLKPGDIVAVDHTPRTRTKMLLDGMFRISLGAFYSLDDAWDD